MGVFLLLIAGPGASSESCQRQSMSSNAPGAMLLMYQCVQVSRAAYMALYVWQPDAPLSAMCGSDAEFCVAKNPLVEKYPGKIMDCLTTMSGRGGNTTAANLKSKLSEDCDTILSIAQPPDIKNTFDTYFQVCWPCLELQGTPNHLCCRCMDRMSLARLSTA